MTTTTSWRSALETPIPVRWACWRLAVAFVLCPLTTAVIVAVGREHRLAAGLLMIATYLMTNAYAAACIVRALGVWPLNCVNGMLWDDTPIVALHAVPALIALARFSDEPVQTTGTATVAVILVVALVRGYRSGFEPRQARTDDQDGPHDLHI